MGLVLRNPRKFHNLLRVLRMNNYDYAKILNAFADIGEIRKLRLEVDNEWRTLRARLEQVKDTLHSQSNFYNMGLVLAKSWPLC